MKIRSIKYSDHYPFIFLAMGLMVLAFASAFQLYLPNNIPHTPNEDLSRHIALALNFREAILAGQILPRLQPGYELVIPDVPVFQYYGFLSSLVSQPWLFLGFSPLRSVVLGVVIIRWIAVMAIYATCRINNLSKQASLVAVIAWLFFPYIQSNFYGRVAIPEAYAQAVLTFIPLSWSLATANYKRIMFFVVILTIILLSLAHPIFLMWGIFTFGAMIITAFFIKKYTIAQLLLVALLLGICISSFQWLPAFLSSKDLATNFLSSSPFSAAYLTSPSAFFGWPKVLISNGGEYYFTVSMWMLPAMVGAVVYAYKNDDSKKNVFMNIYFLLAFLFLAYSPWDFWSLLPKITWATQFPYRLLSFVATFGVIVLAYAIDALILNIRQKFMIFIALIIILLSGPSLLGPNFIRLEGLSLNENVKAQFASQDYIVTSSSKVDSKILLGNKILYGDGWMRMDNIVNVPTTDSDQYIYIEARSGLPNGFELGLKVINNDAKEKNVIDYFRIPANGVKKKILVPKAVKSISFIPDNFFKPSDIDKKSADARELFLLVSYINLADNGNSYFPPSNIERKIISGYSRSFALTRGDNFITSDRYTVDLPLAYSRFQSITQNGLILNAEPTHSGLTRVIIDDFDSPIFSEYRAPFLATLLTIVGFLLSTSCFWIWRNDFVRNRS